MFAQISEELKTLDTELTPHSDRLNDCSNEKGFKDCTSKKECWTTCDRRADDRDAHDNKKSDPALALKKNRKWRGKNKENHSDDKLNEN
jgi:hypothetical protein